MGNSPIHRAGDPPDVYTLGPANPYSNTTVTAEQLEAARQAEARRIDALVKERQRDEAEAAARAAQAAEEHAEAALAPEKAAARAEFLLHNPGATDFAFEGYWRRVKPSVAEVQARQVAADAARLREQRGPLF